ncbi:MAG: hypothetical protein IJM37_09165 [Lachnospiraceae bacterium]|nr:hypothetical protein [Lachnospiraceae bacterium]
MYENVTENELLRMENVVSFRGEVTRDEMDYIRRRIEKIIYANSARQTGNPVTAVHSVGFDKKQIVVDWEIKVPTDRPLELPKEFEFLPEFEIHDALKMHVNSDFKSITEALPKVMEYIDYKGYHPGTEFYVEELDDRTANIYAGLFEFGYYY